MVGHDPPARTVMVGYSVTCHFEENLRNVGKYVHTLYIYRKGNRKNDIIPVTQFISDSDCN